MKKMEITNMHGETIKSLRKARRTHKKIPWAVTKISTILMCLKGNSARQIEAQLQISYQTASKYIHSFNDGGLKQLIDYGKSSGRPKILSAQEEEFCVEMFQLTPKECGVGIDVNWNTRIMQRFIEDTFGKKMTRSAITEMLHRLGFSFTRPTYVLAKADKKKLLNLSQNLKNWLKI